MTISEDIKKQRRPYIIALLISMSLFILGFIGIIVCVHLLREDPITFKIIFVSLISIAYLSGAVSCIVGSCEIRKQSVNLR